MGISGKVVGGILGFVIGGPIGALIGLVLGHLVDSNRVAGGSVGFGRARDHTTFFNTTFAVMGHLCKADGRVSAEEIRAAELVMDQLRLSEARRAEARAMFRAGKAPDFDLADALNAFQAAYGRAAQLKFVFLQIQMSAAWADGEVGAAERGVLHEIARRLRIPEVAFRQVEALVAAMAGRAYQSGGGRPSRQADIDGAYRALGVSPADSDAHIKRAYRRLISQHHPDKLISKGLPEDMMRAATERTAEIKASYDLIMSRRAAGAGGG